MIDAHKFTWTGNHGTIFCSDHPMFMTVVPTAFIVKGKERGVSFHFKERERDAEGDIVAWFYVSDCGQFTIRVFND